ncbi:hypothetical protein E2562_035013 [Oryza meyeriana var. granulata]|uniref:Uncharacterized protein n=1 Tax=Oryza meyeriana var. granulata TaxID=110450 RepID=A0A6G1F1P6_9ORYZ|nr:hypothetical protein E2562_035013 [Oryza meyeriana var. granulata]
MKSLRKKSLRKKGTVHLMSTQSPLKSLDLSWILDGMDGSSACRVAIRVGPYVEFDENGENDEVEYVGVTDKREGYKNLVLDDQEGDPDYEPGSDEDDDDLAVDTRRLIKKLPHKHNCASTAGALKKDLEEKYNIKISYYVVWDGRQMALDEILGKWEDSFDASYNFKEEMERSPGSIIEVHTFKENYI